jgi:AIG2-like family
MFELRRRHAKESDPGNIPSSARPKVAQSRLYDLSTDEGEIEYYRVLAESIKHAQTAIYRSGRGFSEARKSFSHDLIEAEACALRNGVKIVRIQTSDRTSKDWADRYAALIEKYPGQLRVYADFKDPLLVNLGLIDPEGKHPEIQILFESVTTAGGASYPADAAISVDGQARFARSLKEQFEDWMNRLRILDADQVRELARTYMYFACGSNMSPTQMRQRCPSATRLGTGVAYGWKLNFAVAAPHLGATAAAAGIEQSDKESDYIEGVIYNLTAEEKRSIDKIEAGGGYQPATIDFKLKGKHVSGFTHVPIVLVSTSGVKPTESYLELILEGAETNGLTNLAKALRKAYFDDK